MLDAGANVNEDQISTAMVLIALAYTDGSVVEPIITGKVESSQSQQGLVNREPLGHPDLFRTLVLASFLTAGLDKKRSDTSE